VWIPASEVCASISNCSGRIALIDRGIFRALWQSASNGSCQWFMCLRIEGRPVAVASIQTLAGGSGVANTTSRAASILHGSSCAPLNAVEVPDTFVDEALGASDGHPVSDADPRASRLRPHTFHALRANGAAKPRHNRPRSRKIMSAG
jgi:hypothetical protein